MYAFYLFPFLMWTSNTYGQKDIFPLFYHYIIFHLEIKYIFIADAGRLLEKFSNIPKNLLGNGKMKIYTVPQKCLMKTACVKYAKSNSHIERRLVNINLNKKNKNGKNIFCKFLHKTFSSHLFNFLIYFLLSK